METLDIQPHQLIDDAYVDLLSRVPLYHQARNA